MALLLSKGSLLALEHRVSQEAIHVNIVRTIILLCAAILVASVILIGIGCDISDPWMAVESPCLSLVSDGNEPTAYKA